MDFSAPLDGYCERLDPSFWSEPLNAATNASFLIAGVLLYRRYRTDRELSTYALLVFTVGVGSFLFHTFATKWAKAADVLPIGAALLYFLYVHFHRTLALQASGIAKSLAGYGVLSAAFALGLSKETFNESNNYFGTFFLLGILSWDLRRRGKDGAREYAIAAALFACALVFRTIDLKICDAFPYGTHFLWHSLNGVCLYVAGTGLAKSFGGSGRV